ncbi:recombinase family protein [Micromonospora sp. WMMD710]|uniref:helix-turn-helix domain-containing protein n=1 Tax=Micromonospora sp. WMMD710 TaxID=3016085 RepID=UPI002416F361|nr:recombinase family protein [Micromonospora sp. WMMD710]MDG4762238.1 recombinase family protein [Micromonospora sp. WMMD710]
MKELLVFLEDELHARNITLEILTGICAGVHRPGGATLADRLLFAVAALAAEMERELIRDRTLDGLRAAAAAGRHGGRPTTVTDDILAIARARQARGESVTAIARHLSVGRSTLYRALQPPRPGDYGLAPDPAPLVLKGRVAARGDEPGAAARARRSAPPGLRKIRPGINAKDDLGGGAASAW